MSELYLYNNFQISKLCTLCGYEKEIRLNRYVLPITTRSYIVSLMVSYNDFLVQTEKLECSQVSVRRAQIIFWLQLSLIPFQLWYLNIERVVTHKELVIFK